MVAFYHLQIFLVYKSFLGLKNDHKKHLFIIIFLDQHEPIQNKLFSYFDSLSVQI